MHHLQLQCGHCKTTHVASGQGDSGNQRSGDCKKNVCNGAGSPTSIADANDVFDDQNPCTANVCTSNTPQNPPLHVSTACGGGKVCDGAGHCICTDPDACVEKCGAFNDACGRAVNCNENCRAPERCGGSGTSNVCGCSDANACAGKCGNITDACGRSVTCPDNCAAPQTCGGGSTPNVCGCTPHAPACSFDENLCFAPDGCGAIVECQFFCDGFCAQFACGSLGCNAAHNCECACF